EALELLGNRSCRAVDVVHELRMGMDIAPPRHYILVKLRNAVDDRHRRISLRGARLACFVWRHSFRKWTEYRGWLRGDNAHRQPIRVAPPAIDRAWRLPLHTRRCAGPHWQIHYSSRARSSAGRARDF